MTTTNTEARYLYSERPEPLGDDELAELLADLPELPPVDSFAELDELPW